MGDTKNTDFTVKKIVINLYFYRAGPASAASQQTALQNFDYNVKQHYSHKYFF
jgi:hypothetical protein